MTIIKTNVDDKRIMYNLTSSTVRKEKLDNCSRGPVTVSNYVKFTTLDSKGNEKIVLSVQIGDIVYSTISATAIAAFDEILDIFGEFRDVVLCSDISKNGRSFLYFAL